MNKYQVMPPLSADEYSELRADIEERGLLVPVEYDEAGEILDGHHRVQICQELGITEWPRVVRLGLSDAGKITHARKLNLARRHLDRDQKRALIAAQLRDTPRVSDRQVAESLGVSPTTVGTVRNELIECGDVSNLDTRIDSLGREQPATKPERPSAYRYIDSTPEGQKAITDGAKAIRIENGAIRRAENAALRAEARALPAPANKYRCIVIDPPWPVQKYERDCRPNQTSDLDYPTMPIEDICKFDIDRLIADDECHLFCWTTQKHLPATFEILEAWDFNYVFCMVWHKTGGPQPFNLPQYNCEFVLYGRKGSASFLDTKQFFTCFAAPRREHSRKPDEFYELVQRVCPGPRIDVFSREPRDGFAQYGNETSKFAA